MKSIHFSNVKDCFVLFTNWPEILCTGFFSEIRSPVKYAGDSYIAETGNTYFKARVLTVDILQAKR